MGVEELAIRSKEGNYLHGEVEGVPFNDGFISVIVEQILQPHLSRDWMGKVSRSLLLECTSESAGQRHQYLGTGISPP